MIIPDATKHTWRDGLRPVRCDGDLHDTEGMSLE